MSLVPSTKSSRVSAPGRDATAPGSHTVPWILRRSSCSDGGGPAGLARAAACGICASSRAKTSMSVGRWMALPITEH
eukprot:5608603-Lingulodinium_polyedra.AAC.1